MTNPSVAKHRNLFLGLATIIVVLGAMSAMDVGHQPYLGYGDDGNRKVTRVDAGSPAAKAGLQVDDVIKRVNGVALTDTKGLIDMPRPALGDTLPVVVERGGQNVNLQFIVASLTHRTALLARAATLLGLCYLLCTLWAYFAAPGAATTLLALFGLSFGNVFLGVPYFASPRVRLAADEIGSVILLLGLAALVHFLLAFPSRRPLLARTFGTKIVYGPAVVFALINIGFAVVQPPLTSTLLVLSRTIESGLMAGYFLVAITVLVRRFSAASAVDRATHGLGLMLAGAVVGLLPLVVGLLGRMLAPSTVLPASQYYFLTLGLIPITFAMAAVRSAQTAP